MSRKSRKTSSRWQRFLESRFDRDFLQKIQALPTRQNEYGYDAFGFNRDEAITGIYLAYLFHKYYFRADVYGIENVPDGRVLLIANHSGQLPFDGLVIGGSVLFDRDPPRIIRSMIERAQEADGHIVNITPAPWSGPFFTLCEMLGRLKSSKQSTTIDILIDG